MMEQLAEEVRLEEDEEDEQLVASSHSNPILDGLRQAPEVVAVTAGVDVILAVADGSLPP
jgi:hypothetical protein